MSVQPLQPPELEKLFDAFAAQGPGTLTRALLTEIDAVRALLEDQGLDAADHLVATVRSCAAGEATREDCLSRRNTLFAHLRDTTDSHLDPQSYYEYQWACTNLVLAEDERDWAHFTLASLRRSLVSRTGCTQLRALAGQIDRLQDLLVSAPIPPPGPRIRQSLLAA
jgi:hypothetical protein